MSYWYITGIVAHVNSRITNWKKNLLRFFYTVPSKPGGYTEVLYHIVVGENSL